jgi:hypothetical protein
MRPIVSVLLLLALALPAVAAPPDDLKAALMSARQYLLVLTEETDPASQAEFQQAIDQVSGELDRHLAAVLGDPSTSPQDLKRYQSLQEVWNAFRNTRDGEIIPAIRADRKDEAQSLAKGIQAERMQQMTSLLQELGAK